MNAANTAAGSARATVRSTTPPAVFVKDRRPAIWKCLPTRLLQTPKSKSARELRYDEWSYLKLRAHLALGQMVGRAPSDRASDARIVRRLSDAAQSQLSLDVRRHPDFLPRRPDRDGRRACNALSAERYGCVRIDRAHPPRCQLRLDDPEFPLRRRVDVLPRRLHPHVPRLLLRFVQGAARSAVDSRRGHPACDDGHRVHGL